MPAISREWKPEHGIRFASTSALSFGTALKEDLDASYPIVGPDGPGVLSGDESFVTCAETEQEDITAETDEISALLSDGPDDPLSPPVSSLPFNISREFFLQAKNAPEYSEGSYWSYSLYRGPENEQGEPTKVNVHYCRSLHTMERVVKNYFLGEPVIGLDLEWVAESSRYDGVRKNVSLIQIASPSRIALFHVALFPEDDGNLISKSLRQILEDDGVSKCGVCIKADCTRLKTYLDVEVKGIVELSNFYKVVKYAPQQEWDMINKKMVKLADQVQEFLKLPLFKGDVRTGDWSVPLTMPQIVYSASDAYAGIQLYHIYEDRRLALDPVPPRPHFAELGLPIPLPDGAAVTKPKRTKKVAAETKVELTDETVQEEVSKEAMGVEAEVEAEAEAEAEAVSAPGAEISPEETPQSEPISSFTAMDQEAAQEPEATYIEEMAVEAEPELIEEEELEEFLGSTPIIEDRDVNLEVLSQFFDIDKLVASIKDPQFVEPPKEPTQAEFDAARQKEIIAEVDSLISQYHQDDEDIRKPAMRSYCLWHYLDFHPDDIAKILRNPPLAPSTVSSYIMDAIKAKKFYHDSDRLSREVVPGLSPWLKNVRFKHMIPEEVLQKENSGVPMKGIMLRRVLEKALQMLPPDTVQEGLSLEANSLTTETSGEAESNEPEAQGEDEGFVMEARDMDTCSEEDDFYSEVPPNSTFTIPQEEGKEGEEGEEMEQDEYYHPIRPME